MFIVMFDIKLYILQPNNESDLNLVDYIYV